MRLKTYEYTAGNTSYLALKKAVAWFRQCNPPSVMIRDVTLKLLSAGEGPAGTEEAPVN